MKYRRSGLQTILLALVLLLVGACTHHQTTAPKSPSRISKPPSKIDHGRLDPSALVATDGCTPQNPKACAALYDRGLAQAMHQRDPTHANLVPLVPGTKGLMWNDEGDILLATWTKLSYYVDEDGRPKYKVGEEFPLYGDTWFTPVPFTRDICKKVAPFGKEWLHLRLEQLIGLPPGRDKDAFLQVWVAPETIFRPCPDPSTADQICQREVPVRGAQGPSGTPWAFCQDVNLPQVGATFDTIASSHLRWICDNWCTSYCNSTGYPCSCDQPTLDEAYPWTALGYTFDWGRPEDPIGLSEFVVPGKSQVRFESIQPTLEYCRP